MYIFLDGVPGERYPGVGWAVTCIYVANKLLSPGPFARKGIFTRLHTTNKGLASDALTHSPEDRTTASLLGHAYRINQFIDGYACAIETT